MTHQNKGTAKPDSAIHADRSTGRIIMAGSIAILALFGGIGGWAATTSISSATIAPGKVIVEGRAKLVQHAEGGIIGALLVREGDRVQNGQVLIRLDATATQAELNIIKERLFDLRLQHARLTAEQIGSDKFELVSAVAQRLKKEPELATQVAAQRSMLVANRGRLNSQMAQIEARTSQLKEEIAGLKNQLDAKKDEMSFVENDISRYAKLMRKGLMSRTKFNDKKRMRARMISERSGIKASIARAAGQISEMAIRATEMRNARLAEVLTELNTVTSSITELAQRRVKALDLLSRIEIKAPRAGRIHELSVHTVGGVIRSGETLMQIVPDADKLVIEARVAPEDIDQVTRDMNANVRFTAFNQRTTPELSGQVAAVSPDQSVDPQSGIPYYSIRVILKAGQLAMLGGKHLKPGMPADVMITAESRNVLSYLAKPLSDQFERAFREQ